MSTTSLDDVERWFIRQGIPHFIHRYSASEDVLTRTVPFLTLVFLGELLLVYGDRFEGWAQAVVAVGVLAAALVGVAAVNRLRGRRPLQVPDSVGPLEIGLFVLGPALLVGVADADPVEGVLVGLANTVVLGIVYFGTSYGIIPMTRWALVRFVRQASGFAPVIGRTLPLLLLFSAFLFVNAEIWQVASNAPPELFSIVMVSLVLSGVAFVGLALRNTLDEVNEFSSWSEVGALAASGPVPVPGEVGTDGPPAPEPLSRRERVNVGLVLFLTLAIKVLLVALAIGGFYIFFGLFLVREETVSQWVAAGRIPPDDDWWRATLFGSEVVLTRQLVYVTAFITAMAGLQFAVQVVTDPDFRAQYAEDMTAEIRCAAAVRALYLRELAAAR